MVSLSYWPEAVWRSLNAAWEWPNSHGMPFAITTLVCAVAFQAVAMLVVPKLREWLAATLPRAAEIGIRLVVIPGLGGLLTAYVVIAIWHFLYDPSEQIAAWQTAWEKQAAADAHNYNKMVSEKDAEISALRHQLTIPKFNITPGIAFSAISDANQTSGRLYAGSITNDTVILNPINWLVYVTLANNQDVPTTLLDYWGKTLKDDGTESSGLPELCKVELQDKKIYFLGDDSTIGEFKVSGVLHAALRGAQIMPHFSVSGWMAWECSGGMCGPLVKLGIREASGRISETAPFKYASMNGYLQESGITISRVDLGKRKMVYMSSCPNPGNTGDYMLFPRKN